MELEMKSQVDLGFKAPLLFCLSLRIVDACWDHLHHICRITKTAPISTERNLKCLSFDNPCVLKCSKISHKGMRVFSLQDLRI